jgi:hypothetical protein
MLSVIPPLERRWVPGLILTDQPGGDLNLDTEPTPTGPSWMG